MNAAVLQPRLGIDELDPGRRKAVACRLNRLIRMIRLVQAERYPNVQTLCHLFQIKERTLFNDLRELKDDLGVDIQFDRHRRGYYLANESNEINMMALNERNSVLLLIAFALLQYHGDEKLAAPLREIFEQEFRLAFQASATRQASELIAVRQSKNSLDEELFTKLLAACLSERAITITTCTSAKRNGDNGGTVRRAIEIYPRHLELSFDRWYLVYSAAVGGVQLQKIELDGIEAVLSERISSC